MSGGALIRSGLCRLGEGASLRGDECLRRDDDHACDQRMEAWVRKELGLDKVVATSDSEEDDEEEDDEAGG